MYGCWLIPSGLEVIPSSQKLLATGRPNMRAGMRTKDRAPPARMGGCISSSLSWAA